MRNSIEMGLVAQERILRAYLEYSRAVYEHMGNRGVSVEGAFRDFLSKHLARYLPVGTGEVIDSYGHRSGQVDVVISDDSQPFVSPLNDPGLFLVEGVVCAGEVKSRLTTKELRRAIRAGAKFKALQNRHNQGDQIFTNPADRMRYYDCPPFFVLAMESDVNIGTLLTKLHNAGVSKGRRPVSTDSQQPYPTVPPVDAIFVLGEGAAQLMTEGSALLLHKTKEELVFGWVHIENPDLVLSEFLLWLNACMPRVIRHTPISVNYLLGPRTFTTLDQWARPVGTSETPSETAKIDRTQ